jgi:hypothetical protein
MYEGKIKNGLVLLRDKLAQYFKKRNLGHRSALEIDIEKILSQILTHIGEAKKWLAALSESLNEEETELKDFERIARKITPHRPKEQAEIVDFFNPGTLKVIRNIFNIYKGAFEYSKVEHNKEWIVIYGRWNIKIVAPGKNLQTFKITKVGAPPVFILRQSIKNKQVELLIEGYKSKTGALGYILNLGIVSWDEFKIKLGKALEILSRLYDSAFVYFDMKENGKIFPPNNIFEELKRIKAVTGKEKNYVWKSKTYLGSKIRVVDFIEMFKEAGFEIRESNFINR